MRKILLLTILIVGYYLPAFSQFNSRLELDPAFKDFSFGNGTETFRYVDSIDFKGLLSKPPTDKDLLFPELADKNLTFGQDLFGTFETQKSIDNMPCLKPQGYFPMPVYIPDSSVRYPMLIMKIE